MRLSNESLLTCCAAPTWARILSQDDHASLADLVAAARKVWWQATPVSEWLQAFAAHPKLGDAASLRAKFGDFTKLSAGEQQGIVGANDETLEQLAAANKQYEEKFGHIFILCATGKSAAEVLQAVTSRYPNTPSQELEIAAQQQMTITEIRMAGLWSPKAAVPGSGASQAADRRTGTGLRSPVTSHVLDTTTGQPARDLQVTMYRMAPGSRLGAESWIPVGTDPTNSDGRAVNLLPASDYLEPAIYRVHFDTGTYLTKQMAAHGAAPGSTPFYPQAIIDFEVTSETSGQHFHIPLLISPFAYSTYRGS